MPQRALRRRSTPAERRATAGQLAVALALAASMVGWAGAGVASGAPAGETPPPEAPTPAELCGTVQGLADQGLLDAAETVYLEASKASPTVRCDDALATVAERRARAVELMAQGAEREAAEDFGVAREAYLDALEQDQDVPGAGDALTRVAKAEGADEGQTLWDRTKDVAAGLFSWAEAWLKVGGLLVVVAVVLALLYLVARRLWDMWRPRLIVADFESVVARKEGEADLGKMLTALVADEMSGAQENGGSLGLVLDVDVRAVEVKIEPLPEGLVPDAGKFLTALLEPLRRRRARLVTGRLHRLGADCLKASVTISTTSGGIIAHESFSQDVVGTDDEAIALMAPMIGAWAYFNGPRGRPEPLLGTRNWVSWGRFRCGVRLHRSDRSQHLARNEFLIALEEDRKNLGALLNLASLDVRSEKEEGFERALHRLQRADEQLKRFPGWYTHPDPQWYRVQYQLAVTMLHLDMHRKGEQYLDAARGRAADLVQQSAMVLHGSESRTWRCASCRRRARRRRDALESLVRSSEARVVALLASIQMVRGKLEWQEGERLPETVGDLRRMSVDNPPSAFALMYYLSDRTKSDGTLASLTFNRVFSYSAQYNIACFYARHAELERGDEQESAKERAFEALGRSLEKGGELVDWARKDPTLQWLRTDPEFEKVLGKAEIIDDGGVLPNKWRFQTV